VTASFPGRELWIPVSSEEKEEVARVLHEVLLHPMFSNSKRYPTLLRYVVEQTLEGRGEEIKERTIGIDVFGRPPDYDTNLDTIVRYTAGEVRKRLAVYYRDIGDVPIQIRLTARSYHAEFLRLVEAGSPPQTADVAEDVIVAPVPPPAPIPVRKQSGVIHWMVLLAALLFLALIGFYSWNRLHNDAVSRFWGPLIEQKTQTTISLGGVTVSPQSKIGTTAASDVGGVNPYLSFENGLALGRVAVLLNARGGAYRVQPSSSTTLAGIRENPTVLVGAYNNAWTYRLAAPLRFHFTPHPDEQIVDAQAPGRRWVRDGSRPFNDAPDYALVARFRNPSTDSIVVLIGGLQRFGTDAASQFVTSSEQLEVFNRLVGADWRDRNVEVVLRVDVVNGRAGAPVIVATYVW
jgi:hypothetical protein